MRSIPFFLILPLALSFCIPGSQSDRIEINEAMLLSSLETLSHDSMEGRSFGSKGNFKAQKFIAGQFEKLGISPAFDKGYTQDFPYTLSGRRRQRMFPVPDAASDFSNVPDTTVHGGNIVAKIQGEVQEVIVITGHLDHLGIRNGEIYNGADDDASGTAALFAIADYFKTNSPKHSLVFAAVDAEEIGSPGCQYLVDNFPIDLQNVVLNVNMDMIAHNDSLEMYSSGIYHYPQLKAPLESVVSPITLLYGHDDPDNDELDDWTYSSDHRIFHQKNIPFIYFGVEDHKDYHEPTDTFENINKEFYIEAVKLIIQAIENYDEAL